MLYNFDEATFTSTSSKSFSWDDPRGPRTRSHKITLEQVHLLLTVGSDGTIYRSFLQGRSNSYVFIHHLLTLINTLEKERPGFRRNSIFLWDNASTHSSAMSVRVARSLGLRILPTAPASYSALAIERVFAVLKTKDMLPALAAGRR